MLGTMRILVLGGTADGRAVAPALAGAGHEVITSLAGRTAQARETPGAVTGGFGGPDGLARWLGEHRIDAIVDATHPFAARMTKHAVEAASASGTPLVRLDRPGWGSHPLADTWAWTDDHEAAALAAAGWGRALLTVGRQPLHHYLDLPDAYARVAELPDGAPSWPAGWTVVAERGPFAPAEERRLMAEEDIGVLVTKDSGGEHTAAKLDAAHEWGARVVVVRRPALPHGLVTVPDVTGVLMWLAGR